jgi:ureidoglycolate lyase/seryl-tRNA synthetase
MVPLPPFVRPDIPRYDAPPIGAGLRVVEAPLVVATAANLRGYGRLVDDPEAAAIQIVRWPAAGTRPVDPDCGDEGGVTEGEFACQWRDGRLQGTNAAVGGAYVLGVASRPDALDGGGPGRFVLLWHANYHPDGGPMFFPRRREPFVVPMALPGDDVRPESFVNFWFDGTQGLYLHPGVWHEGVFPCGAQGSFLDRQGAVHARVSCEFPREFGCLLSCALPIQMPVAGH